MKLEDVTNGMLVAYVPMHANGNLMHPDVEDGVVSSKNDRFVFVKYHKQVSNLGWEGATAQATRPEDLIQR